MDFCRYCDVHIKNLKQHQRSAKHLKNVELEHVEPEPEQYKSLIQEQNDAFLQSLEIDQMKEIEKINEACDVKPTLEELRKLRTHFFNKQNMM